MKPHLPDEVPAAPEGAAGLFGDRLPLAIAYAGLLADSGVSHGLIGPREVPRLWDRHLINCAVVQSAFPSNARVIDIGSGAGLPGLVLAIARPDLRMILLEPMQRRTQWLTNTVTELGLTNAEVVRGRADGKSAPVRAQWATARAVARLDKLAGWAKPLLSGGGTLVALKGESAEAELEEDAGALAAMGASATYVEYEAPDVEQPTRTIQVRFSDQP